MKKAVLHDLFIMEVQDLYDAEQQLLDALPKMAAAATNSDLKAGIELHLTQTEDQIARLEELSELMEFELEGQPCEAMEGLVAEGEEILDLDMIPTVLDLAIITAALKIEMYEKTGYEMTAMLANEMDHAEAEKLLKKTRDEEEKTADILEHTAKKILKEIQD